MKHCGWSLSWGGGVVTRRTDESLETLETDGLPARPDRRATAGPPPMVTVIIAVYNRPQYLRQAVCSVLGQTYPNVELLVVDDGSEIDFGPLLAPFGTRVTL